MWRDVVTLIVGINGIGAMVGYWFKRRRSPGALRRALDAREHREYQEQLLQQNAELDESYRRIERTPHG